ncbi:hypothetical protein TPHA_0H02060 [Tetrapisispora phaffii CBS 4417]|uniref:Spindle pole body-associated protein Vik1/Cik1 microtubule binding domain-containing protein n=1 Tax=Tetrapisispora phaffii (strain ATCC 24235 / CBS 4417 / NBRC 1672 / NRRL Y-8282 / UCD 70-5) TaxID=1071381 RepID=G8BWF9_TETPH|nr:hypothetical protein TPHA_0H02060 [Tetrapisispora phaffii CBS 4417]CCE64410.1 hypothetical protein TPHA_0H02060 [Tetrapisispora phaffii CBS 4417]
MSNNTSKIPSLSLVDNTFDSTLHVNKKLKLSSDREMLSDVTNNAKNKYSYRKNSNDKNVSNISRLNSLYDMQNRRLMNKYIYGDAHAVEEVKKRERKIIKDMNHLINAIAEIDKETSSVMSSDLPEIRYQISKKKNGCAELEKEIMNLNSMLDLKQGDLDLFKRNEELEIKNLHLKYEVELQELENELQEELNQEKFKWEKQKQELENMKPSEEIAQEIEILKGELESAKIELNNIINQNEIQLNDYKAELQNKFEEFKKEKKAPLDKLISNKEQLKENIEKYETEIINITKEQDLLKKSQEDLREKIENYSQKLKNSENEMVPLNEKLMAVSKEFEILKSENDKLKELAFKEEQLYKEKYEQVEEEQLRRKKLENSIDELKGTIRCVAYYSTTELQDAYSIDIPSHTITSIDVAGNENNLNLKFSDNVNKKDEVKSLPNMYEFNRVIPSELIEESMMLCDEYQCYHDMCLENRTNFNLISVSASPWNKLRKAVFQLLIPKYLEKYNISLQSVFLSEEVYSQDLLLQYADTSMNPEDIKDGIDLKIEENSIELNSYSMEIKEDISELPTEVIEPKEITESGINILKFKFLEKNESELEQEENPINYYFVEFYNLETNYVLEKYVTPGETPTTPIGMIIKKLIQDTKSYFIFKMDKVDVTDLFTNISNKVSKLKNPKRKPN